MTKNEFKEELQVLELSSSFEDILKFVTSTQCFTNWKYRDHFWESDLPTKWFSEFMSSSLQLDLLIAYFEYSKRISVSFLKKVCQQHPNPFIKTVKLTKAFEHQAHWESFFFLKLSNNRKLKNFYQELEYIRNSTAKWEEDALFYKGVIVGYSYEDILIHTISYFEKFKRSSQRIVNNNTHKVMIEMNLCYVLNNILNIKKALIQDKKAIDSNYPIKEFQDRIEQNLPPINPPEGIIVNQYLPKEKITEEKALLRETIEFFYSQHDYRIQIDKYLAGFADFYIIDELESEIITNRLFTNHSRNDGKHYFQENYYFSKVVEQKPAFLYSNKELYERQNQLAVESAFEYWKNLKLPSLIQTKYFGKVDTKKVLIFLRAFSNYIMPEGRNIVPKEKNIDNYQDLLKNKNSYHILKRQKPQQFEKLFGTGYMYVIDAPELIQKCESYFEWESVETENIINYLTTDLSSTRNFTIDFLTRPLIKIGNQYIWLSSLLRDRKWEVQLHERLVKDKLNDHNKVSEKMEAQLAKDFEEAGFGAISSYCFKLNNGESGEIDVLAYADNTLFIIELKTTYVNENIMRKAKYFSHRFESKAVEQLKKALVHIEENFLEIKKDTGLKIECALEDLKIVPLIVSNIFEYDDLIIQRKFLKTSLFQLLLILKNDLYNMLICKSGILFDKTGKIEMPFTFTLSLHNQNNRQFKNNTSELTKENCNLWSNPDHCSSQDLLDAIMEDKIWKVLDELRHQVIPHDIGISIFDKNHKWMI